VLAAICAVVGVDAWAAMTTERGAQALSANALRSVELAEDMRWQLSALGLGPESVAADAEKVEQALAWLGRDVAAYEPLATFEGERPEWLTLSQLTREIAEDLSSGDRAEARRDVSSAQVAVERLIALNRAEADSIEMQLAGLGRRQVAVDGLAGVVVVLVFAGMARARLRSLEREREAVALSLETVQSKNQDLEAFAGRVAHDLRSPLAPVQVLAGVLARGGQPDSEVQRLGTRIAGRRQPDVRYH
jgi:signal transduction histidine kinase